MRYHTYLHWDLGSYHLLHKMQLNRASFDCVERPLVLMSAGEIQCSIIFFPALGISHLQQVFPATAHFVDAAMSTERQKTEAEVPETEMLF